MTDVRCAPGLHVGEDLEGRCSLCGDRIERPSLLLTVLVFVAVALATLMAVGALLAWWSA